MPHSPTHQQTSTHALLAYIFFTINLTYYECVNFLSASGVNHEELCELAEKYFGKMTAGYDGEIPVLPQCRFTGSEVSGL